MPLPLVQDHAALAAICERLATSPWIALDTEFMRERTYYAKLGLVQVATADVVACIDPLALDITPLLDVLYNPGTLKVLHAGRQDLEVLHDLRRAVPQPVFDTQIAAALLGHAPQIGYAALVEATTGVKLAKLHTRADWEARPLTQEQLHYAADDVIYLRDVYRKLDQQLRERGRFDWLVEECAALADPALYRNDPQAAYTRLNPGNHVAPAAQPLLKALAIWREQTAQKRDRPRGWIVPDAVLIEIARAAPADSDALARVPQVTAPLLKNHGDDILNVVQLARTAPPERIWRDARPPTPAQQGLVRRMLNRVQEVARASELQPEVVATKRAVHALLDENAGPLTRGWRYTLIGQELAALARGDGNG